MSSKKTETETAEAEAPLAVGYIRVSTLGQAIEGVSLEAQRAKIEQYCAYRGLQLVGVFQDAGLSGTKMKGRAGLAQALKVAQKDVSLVTYSISRLARSTLDMALIAKQLEKQEAHLVSLTEDINTASATGRMIYRMLTVLAEFESELTGERTRFGMARLKANGKKFGTPDPKAGGEVNRVRCAAMRAAIEQELSKAEIDDAGRQAVAQLRAAREAAKVAP